jgi:hypothetical protein
MLFPPLRAKCLIGIDALGSPTDSPNPKRLVVLVV